MQSETDAPSIQRVTFEWIDTQSVFRVYAAITCCIGVSIVGTGFRGIPGLPLAHMMLIWIAGMTIIAAACAGFGLALNDDPVSRRRALYRFAVGHVLLGLILWIEWPVYWRDQGLPLLVALAPLIIGIVLVAVAFVAPPADDQATSPRKLRSSYETHIRQLARREERARLARDLHDAVKQQLFVIQTAAATVQTRLDHDSAGARTALEHVRTAAREATTEMEALLEELQAAPMENTGLVEALRKQCDALAFRTGATVSFEPGPLPPEGRLPPGAHEAIYRVAQEALANVARHARASRVTLSMASTAAGFELRVADNGSGFDPNTIKRGMGTANMEARAAEIGGRLAIAGKPSGTDVILSLPVTRDMLSAWGPVRVVGLLVLFNVVFYGIRGHAPEQPGLLILEQVVIWAILNLALAYRRKSRSGSR